MIKKITCFLVLAVFLFTVGCSGTKSNTSKENSEKSKSNQNNYVYTIKVVGKNKEYKKYTLEDISKLPSKSIVIDGKEQKGPLLSTLLSDAGVTSFSKVTVKGISKSSITLAKDKIGEDTILDVANRGTVKLASKQIKKEEWIKDIVEIDVEE